MASEFASVLGTALGVGFVVERELGGGMSRVFLARDTALARRVVIKVLPPELAGGVSADRFRREILLVAGLQHPHIVPLLSAGELPDGTVYYTMPFVEGESLRARLGRDAVSIDQSLRWLRDIASALAHAHAQGIVHRDGENVRLTSVGVSLGTPAYMASARASAWAGRRTVCTKQPLCRSFSRLDARHQSSHPSAAANVSVVSRSRAAQCVRPTSRVSRSRRKMSVWPALSRPTRSSGRRPQHQLSRGIHASFHPPRRR